MSIGELETMGFYVSTSTVLRRIAIQVPDSLPLIFGGGL
jgi:hypothetical protein